MSVVLMVIASQRVGAKRRPMASFAKIPWDRSRKKLDCFVAEPVIGPAEGRTRWLLAMTTINDSVLSDEFR